MKIFACFPSKYLKAADLCDRNVTATMSHVGLEDVGNDDAKLLPILYFEEVQKGMVLNKTNAKAIAAAYGDETNAWKDKPIVLFSAMVAYGTETVEAIRVKVPAPRHGGPTAHERRQAFIQAQPDPAAAAERMTEAWAERQAGSILKAMRSHQPEPAARLLNEAMAVHAANGVVWEETAERLATEEEKAEILRDSLQRANAAMEERRTARGATNPDDGLDIPVALDRRPRPPEPEYRPNSWIEHMLAAE